MYKNMTNEQLVVRYQAAEKGGYEANELLAVLIKRMEGMMVQYVNKYRNIPNTDFEDRYSVVLEHFIIALDEFDDKLGNKLTTVCKKYFSQGLNRLHRDMTRAKRYNPNVIVGSYELAQEIRKEQEESGRDVSINTTFSEFDRVEVMQLLSSLNLSEKQMEMCMGFIDGENAKDIAERLDVTPQTISWYKKVVRDRMKAALSF